MESNETINSDLSAVKGFSDSDLDDLLVLSQQQDDADLSEFQYHQSMDIPLHTTDLFADAEKEETSNQKTRKYPEFSLCFSLDPKEPSLLLNTQSPDKVDLSQTSNQSKLDESVFVRPQIKDEPLDLSLNFPIFPTITSSNPRKNVVEGNCNPDLNFSTTPTSPGNTPFTVGFIKSANTETRECPPNVDEALLNLDIDLAFPATSNLKKNSAFTVGLNKPSAEEIDPYQVDPSCSRGISPSRHTNIDLNIDFSSSVSNVESPSLPSGLNKSFGIAEKDFTRASAMEFLSLNYSHQSLDEAGTLANTRRELHSSQNAHQIDATLIPNSVQRLHQTIKKSYSDFAFVYSLATQMCQDRVPMDCFVHLKIGLLLSIASLEDNPDRPPISVVAIGPEFSLANYLMEAIGNVAERFIGPHDDFKVPVSKNCRYTWIEADPIVMARGGIYYVGDWGRLKEPRSFKLLKTIENGRVALERTTMTCPLETAIWTHWRSYKYDTKDQHTFNKFFEIFGIPLIVEEENHEVLVDFILEHCSTQEFESTVDELSIGLDEMRDFLSIVSKRRVDLSNEASEILRKYFVASRIDRPDCLTERSFSSLKLFAESFAKLSLRHDVITIDAIAAIYMTENVIYNLFGEGTYPPPKFQAHTYIGAVDEHLVQFQEWVSKYVAQFLDD